MDDKPPAYEEAKAASAPYAAAYPPPDSLPPYAQAVPYPAAPYPPGPAGAGPPPIGFAPMPSQPAVGYASYTVPQTTVYVQQPMAPLATSVHFGRVPVFVTCPQCRQTGMTIVSTDSGCLSWLLCALLCLFGLWFGCCLIPFCIDSTKNCKHKCYHCRRVLGYYSPL